jgi:hypothetical protein
MKPQLSLRDLCFVVLVVALGCGWWSEHRRAETAERRAEEWRAEASQSQGNRQLYRALYAAVEKSGFHIRWDLHGVPQGLIPAANFAGEPAPATQETDSRRIRDASGS